MNSNHSLNVDFFHKIGFKFSLRCCIVECVIYDGHQAMLIFVWISISVSPHIIFVETMMRMIIALLLVYYCFYTVETLELKET